MWSTAILTSMPLVAVEMVVLRRGTPQFPLIVKPTTGYPALSRPPVNPQAYLKEQKFECNKFTVAIVTPSTHTVNGENNRKVHI